MSKAIEAAIVALEYKDADYTKVDEAIAKFHALDKAMYKDLTKVESAIGAVITGKNITEQSEVDEMSKAIEAAILALEQKDEPFIVVGTGIPVTSVESSNRDESLTKVESNSDTVVPVPDNHRNTEQSKVGEMEKFIEDDAEKGADYTKENESIVASSALNKEEYKALTVVVTEKDFTEQFETDEKANNVVAESANTDKDITEPSNIDGTGNVTEDVLDESDKKIDDVSKSIGTASLDTDNNRMMLWVVLLLLVVAVVFVMILTKKNRENHMKYSE